MSTYGKRISFDRAKEGDRLLVWIAGSGYVGHAVVTGPMRSPASRAEAPWPGGPYRFAAVVPMEVELDLCKPLMLPFTNQRQALTGLSLFQFRRGFIHIGDSAAEAAVAAMEAASQEEPPPS